MFAIFALAVAKAVFLPSGCRSLCRANISSSRRRQRYTQTWWPQACGRIQGLLHGGGTVPHGTGG